MSGKRQKTQDSLASEQTDRGETLVSGYEGAEPLVAKPEMFSQWCIGAKHLGRKELKGNAVTTPGEYRSREERERMELRRDWAARPA